MSDKEIQEFTDNINNSYKAKTGNRLVMRTFADKWYVCCMVPIGEVTLHSGTLESCMDYMKESIM